MKVSYGPVSVSEYQGSPGQAAMVDLQSKSVCSPFIPPGVSLFPWLVVLPLSSKYMVQHWFSAHGILSSGFSFWASPHGNPCDYRGLCQMTGVILSQNPHPVTSATPFTPIACGNENLDIHSCAKYVIL